MKDSFASYKIKKQKKKRDICAVMRKAKERNRMEREARPVTYAIDTVDPLYTLVFTDHLIGKEYVFTLHRSNRMDQFKIDVNGVPWKDCGWTDLLAEIRRKRVKIGRMR